MKKKLLLTSILSIVMCFSLICGATFALFTSESKVNIAVTSGTVSVTANVGTVETGSTLGDEFVQYEYVNGVYNVSTMVAGDYIKFPVSITSDSDVDIMYRVRTALSGELAQEVDVVIENASGVMGNNAMTSWIAHNANVASVDDYTITISLDKDNKTANGGKELQIQLLVEAVQGNAVSSTPTNATQLENALNYGGVVTLGADIVLDKPIVVNADAVATLDFAGKTISTSSNFVGTHAIENNGTLTLIDSGNAGGSGASGYASERAMVSTFAVRFEETATAPKGGIVSSKGAILNKGVLTIEGGEYTAQAGAIIEVEETATVEINGGSFIAASTAVVVGGTGSVEINKVDKIEGTIIEEGSSSDVVFGEDVAIDNKDDYYVAIEDGIYYKKNGNSYRVTNANGLKWLSGKYLVDNNNKAESVSIELMNNIDMDGEEFKELGVAYGDTMNFDGKGYTISNIKFTTGKHNGMTNVGMFYIDAGATLNVQNLKFVNPVVENGIDGYTTGAAVVVGYANGAVNLNNVDVENASVNNTYGNAAVHIGYCVNIVNLTDCDIIGKNTVISGEVEDGAVRMDKTGAFVATANTASCVVTTKNCINESSYRDFGRVIYGAKWNTAELIEAIKNAPVGETTEIILADRTYAGDIKITLAELKQQGGDVVIKAAEGAKPVIAGTVTLGYREQTVGATMYNANVTFDGITFDHIESAKHSIDIQDVKSLTLNNCTVIGDGEYGISCARGNATGTSKITECTFINAGMQLLGNYATGLVIDGCTFTESCINVQAGNGVTVQNCTFTKTLTSANVGDSFYAIRSNSTPITVKNCEINIDSKLTEVVTTAQAKWYLLANRGTTNWTVEDVKVTMTDAALMQTELKVTACTSTGAINCTNLTVNGVVQ